MITGTLDVDVARGGAGAASSALGGKVTGSVSKKTTGVVVGAEAGQQAREGAGARRPDARRGGVPALMPYNERDMTAAVRLVHRGADGHRVGLLVGLVVDRRADARRRRSSAPPSRRAVPRLGRATDRPRRAGASPGVVNFADSPSGSTRPSSTSTPPPARRRPVPPAPADAPRPDALDDPFEFRPPRRRRAAARRRHRLHHRRRRATSSPTITSSRAPSGSR